MAKTRTTLGDESYDQHEFGTPWWIKRAKNKAHQQAYNTIAKTAYSYCTDDPAVIVDYACGPALLIRELAQIFPNAQIVGLDESQDAIDGGKQLLAEAELDRPDLDLIQAVLPAPDLALPKADLLCFSFPDFRGGCTPAIVKELKQAYPDDWSATKAMRSHIKKNRDEDDFPASASSEIFFKRMATRHYASLLKKGGIAVRVEYGQCNRWECDTTMLQEMDWIDGCIKPPKKWDGKRNAQHIFKLLGSRYVRSDAVMKDVYHQTGDLDDLTGGYLISVFSKR